MNNFNGTDYAIGAIVWIVAMIFAVNSTSCLNLDNCNGYDFSSLGSQPLPWSAQLTWPC